MKTLTIIILLSNFVICQDEFSKILNDRFNLSEKELLESKKSQKVEKKTFGENSIYSFEDTLKKILVKYTYIFPKDSTGKKALILTTVKKNENEIKLLIDYFTNETIKLTGKPTKETEMFGTKMVHWENDKQTISIMQSNAFWSFSIYNKK